MARELSTWDSKRYALAIEAIYDTTLELFWRAHDQGIPTSQAADRLAEKPWEFLPNPDGDLS